MRHVLTSVDRRYREAQGAVSSADRTERLIGRYKERAALENRRAGAMGGSTGQPDPAAGQRRGMAQAHRGADHRSKEAVFALARADAAKRPSAERDASLGG